MLALFFFMRFLNVKINSETLVSDLCHVPPVSELLVPGFGRPVLLCQGRTPRARGMTAYIRDGYRALRLPKFVCGCCEMLILGVCGVRQNLHLVFTAILT